MLNGRVHNILDLVNKIEHHQVNVKSGAGKDIVYVYRKTNHDEPTRAIVSCDRNDVDESNSRFDVWKFCSVQLENEPMRRDAIKYAGDTYIIQEWKGVDDNTDLYDLITRSHESEMHYRGRR